MKNSIQLFATLFLALGCFYASAQEEKTMSQNPLDIFSPLIGGQWYLDNTYQVFEWGIGKKSVRSRSYALSNDQPVLVSEGMWYWHPGENVIKGFFTAINMPFDYFDYKTKFENGQLTSELTVFAASGPGISYVETIRIIDDESYLWSLLDGGETVMGGTFKRKGK